MTKNILALTIAFTATVSSAFASTPTVDVNQSNVAELVFSVPAEVTGDQANAETSAILHAVKGSRGYRGHRGHRGHRSHRNYAYHSYRGHSRYGYGYNRNQNRNGHNNHRYQSNSLYQTKTPNSLGVMIFKDIY